ncbi:EF-hand domain-containing protein [Streptomyces huasconensis]|uniref:EF-hand domain-containing protein n=1 Tax=Streptomyces huasconensis TaxID=1854574 RepID=UPI0033C06049
MTTTADPIAIKLNRLFDVADTNADGYVEWADYERIIDRLLAAYKIDKSDRRAQTLRVAYQMYWMELLRHADGESRLSRDQYHLACRFAAVDTSRFNLVEGLPHALFDVMDTDGDDSVSQAEFKQYLEAWAIADPTALEAFAKLDTDGDGFISRHEFIRAVREFFYSPDLDAPGSLIFGAVGT